MNDVFTMNLLSIITIPFGRRYFGVVLLDIITGGVLLSLGNARAGDESQRVKAQDKAVVKDGKIDHKNKEEESPPDSVQEFKDKDGKTRVRIISKTFLPAKGGWKFKLFDETNTHIDIWGNPETVLWVAPVIGKDNKPIDKSNKVQIEGVIAVPTNAGNFPLRVEGNLNPPPGGRGDGDGKAKRWHWAVKVADCQQFTEIVHRRVVDEKGFLPIAKGESVCKAEKFAFKVTPAPSNGSAFPNTRYEVINTKNGTETIRASGVGGDFEATFTHTGNTFVRFYCDMNGNKRYDKGESNLKSENFIVKPDKIHNVTVGVAGSIGGNIAARLDQIEKAIKGMTRFIHTKIRDPFDKEIDFRACAVFKVNGFSTFASGAGTNTPDVIKSLADLAKVRVAAKGTTLTIVKDIFINEKGNYFPDDDDSAKRANALTTMGVPNTTVIGAGFLNAVLFAHEFGHQLNLEHRKNNTAALMLPTAGIGHIINQAERDAFEK